MEVVSEVPAGNHMTIFFSRMAAAMQDTIVFVAVPITPTAPNRAATFNPTNDKFELALYRLWIPMREIASIFGGKLGTIAFEEFEETLTFASLFL